MQVKQSKSGSIENCGECPLYKKCLFHMKRYGGFKDKGPKNVAYRIVTDAVERYGAKEDFCTCFNFVENIQDRMLTSQALRAEGKENVEIITVLTTPTVRKRFQVAFNARNEVVKPMPHLVKLLEEQNYKVNLMDLSGNSEFRHVTLTMPVPEYIPASQMRDAYAHEIYQREMKHSQDEQELEDKAWEEAMKRQRKEDERNRAANPAV